MCLEVPWISFKCGSIYVRFESTQTQEGGELCWQIFSSFWKQA